MARKVCAWIGICSWFAVPILAPGRAVGAIVGDRREEQGEALGVIETRTVAAVLGAADAGVKGARVALLEILMADGLGGKGYLLFGGTVSEVEAAVEIGVASLADSSQLVAHEVIARLDPGMWSNLIEHPRFGTYLVDSGIAEDFRRPDSNELLSFIIETAMNTDALSVRKSTAEWIAERGFAEVVVLASAPSTEAKAPGEIGGTSFQHVTASDVPDDRCVAAGIAHRKTSGGGGGATADQKITREDDDRALPPWSLMRALRAKNVTAVALIATCSEGDNTEDAAAMADAVAGVLGLGLDRGGVEIRAVAGEKIDEKTTDDGSARVRWTIPPSWRAAYGQQPMASRIFA